jgi:hypothetical protein
MDCIDPIDFTFAQIPSKTADGVYVEGYPTSNNVAIGGLKINSSYGDVLWLQDVLDREISPIKTKSYINDKGNLEVFIHEDDYKFSTTERYYQFFLNHAAIVITNSTRLLAIEEPYYWKPS